MAINVDGPLPRGVTAKDIILAVIAKIGTGGGQGHVIEYRGSTIESLSMEGRMTICNMSIEVGAAPEWWPPTRPPTSSCAGGLRADRCRMGRRRRRLGSAAHR